MISHKSLVELFGRMGGIVTPKNADLYRQVFSKVPLILSILPDASGLVIIEFMDKKYHIWTEGCQMNVADSQRVASALERMGYQDTRQAEDADVIILNTCVVRQSAEDKAYGRLQSLRPLKDKRPDLVINLMGCLVGVKGSERLQKRFPFVDVFSPPSDPAPLVAYLSQAESRSLEQDATEQRFAWMDEELASEFPLCSCRCTSAATWFPRMCRWYWAARMPAPFASSPTGAG